MKYQFKAGNEAIAHVVIALITLTSLWMCSTCWGEENIGHEQPYILGYYSLDGIVGPVQKYQYKPHVVKPSDWQVITQRAEALAERGEYYRSMYAFNSVFHNDYLYGRMTPKQRYQLHLSLGEVLMKVGILDRAQVTLREATALGEAPAQAHHLLGLLLLAHEEEEGGGHSGGGGGGGAAAAAAAGWAARAATHLKNALYLSPDHLGALRALGSILYASGNIIEGEHYLRRLLDFHQLQHHVLPMESNMDEQQSHQSLSNSNGSSAEEVSAWFSAFLMEPLHMKPLRNQSISAVETEMLKKALKAPKDQISFHIAKMLWAAGRWGPAHAQLALAAAAAAAAAAGRPPDDDEEGGEAPPRRCALLPRVIELWRALAPGPAPPRSAAALGAAWAAARAGLRALLDRAEYGGGGGRGGGACPLPSSSSSSSSRGDPGLEMLAGLYVPLAYFHWQALPMKQLHRDLSNFVEMLWPGVNEVAEHADLVRESGLPSYFFVSVAIVCLVDIVLNTLKPYYVTCFTDDGTGCLGARLQRAVWELGMAGMALLCSNPARPPTPAGLLLLQGMLFLTAVIDLLFFAPVYGFATNFERCVCRKEGFFGCQDRVCSQDYAFGLGRLSVVVQSMATGLFFFAKAIVAGGAYRHYRDEAKARTQARAMGMALGQFQQQQHAPTVPAPSPPDGRPLPQQQVAMVGSPPVRTDGHDEGADSVADLEQEKTLAAPDEESEPSLDGELTFSSTESSNKQSYTKPGRKRRRIGRQRNEVDPITGSDALKVETSTAHVSEYLLPFAGTVDFDDPDSNHKVHVVIFSSFFYTHPVGRTVLSMLHFLKDSFEFTVLAFPLRFDEVTQIIRSLADNWVALPPGDLAAALRRWRRLGLAGGGGGAAEKEDGRRLPPADVLLLPDWPDPRAWALAGHRRLAPVQAVFSVRAMPPNLISMDYYLVGEYLVSEDEELCSSFHLSELATAQTVHLPGLGYSPLSYVPFEAPEPRYEFGGRLFYAGQRLYAVAAGAHPAAHPAFARALVALLRNDPQAIIVFIPGGYDSSQTGAESTQLYRHIISRISSSAGQQAKMPLDRVTTLYEEEAPDSGPNGDKREEGEGQKGPASITDSPGRASLSHSRVVLLPPLAHPDRLSFLAAAKVVLSPFPAPALYSAMEALLQSHTPVVSLGGKDKSIHTGCEECVYCNSVGQLIRLMGAGEHCVAESVEDYLQKALQVGMNETLQLELRYRLKENSAQFQQNSTETANEELRRLLLNLGSPSATVRVALSSQKIKEEASSSSKDTGMSQGEEEDTVHTNDVDRMSNQYNTNDNDKGGIKRKRRKRKGSSAASIEDLLVIPGEIITRHNN